MAVLGIASREGVTSGRGASRVTARVFCFDQKIRGIAGKLQRALHGDAGMSTAEYAIGTVAAAAFASVLYSVVTGGSVAEALTSLVRRALETSL